MQTQFKIMKWAVTKCPSIELKIVGESVPTLLDSGSMVSLIWQDHFIQYFRLQLGPAEGSVADAHHLFDITSHQWWGHTIIQICQTGCGIFRATGTKGQIPIHPES